MQSQIDVLNADAGDPPSAATADRFLFLSDMTGRLLRRHVIADGAGRRELDVRDLAPGLYLVRLLDASGELLGARKVAVGK